jgi:hypothetical protein
MTTKGQTTTTAKAKAMFYLVHDGVGEEVRLGWPVFARWMVASMTK